jgi:DnaJ family protein C protein 11
MWPPRNFIAALLPSEIAQAAGIAPAAPSGLTITTFSFLYRRGEHRVSLPFIVSAAPSVNTAARSLVLPVLLYRTFTLIADRLIEKRRRVDLVRRRVTAEPWLRREQQRATLEQRGMQDAVRARAAQENRIGGLVITNATYGVLRPRLRYPDFESTLPSSPAAGAPTATAAAALRPTSLTFDVTVAVQNLVRESRLHLPEGTSKVELAGFYDPHPYAKSSSSSSADAKDRSRCVERKQLRIQYRFNGRRHEAVFDDLDSVTLPLPQHVLRSQMR